MASSAAIAAVLVGAVWIALAFLALALFFLLAPLTGLAGAALIAALAALLFVLIGYLILARRLDAMQRNSLMGSVIASGALGAAANFAASRPLLSLGLGGALAVILAKFTSTPSK
jgi:hypothetical protein